MTISAQNLLDHMQVPGYPEVYVLGCFERRVTLYSQQVRALNLVWALFHEERLAPDDKVAVIGGGAAGLTAAAAALHLGANVTLLEKSQGLLDLQRGCLHRWLHPHIYNWPEPGSEDPSARLPLLDWHAASADEVVRKLEAGWAAYSDKAPPLLGVNRINVTAGGRVTWHAPTLRTDTFRAVILAVGFGVEGDDGALPVSSYWREDDLHQTDPSNKKKRFLVSGCGDGGLIDLLRIRLHDFRQDQMVTRISACEGVDDLKASLIDIENEAWRPQKSGKDAPTYLFERYQDLKVHPSIDAVFPRKQATSAVLCSVEGKPYTLGASPLNRFLVSRLLHGPDGGVELRQGTISETSVERLGFRYKVSFTDGAPEEFDHLVIRHGPTSALKRDFPAIWKAADPVLRPRSGLDQTRKPLWKKGDFGPEPDPADEEGPPAPADPARSAVPVSLPPGIILEDYLARLQERAGYVTLAGDTERRSLGDVFVQLDITRAGAIPTPAMRREEPEEGKGGSREDLDLEIARRKEGPFEDRAKTEMIAGESLLDLARHTLIVGAAGTGKSTLIRWLACRAAKAREGHAEARIPIWLPRLPSYREIEPDLAQELAQRALKAVDFEPGPSPARDLLAAAIQSGRAVILIDSLDEAGAEEQRDVAPILSKIPGNVILASRPQLAEGVWSDVVQVTLQGIPALAAERMLKNYFPGEDWVAELIKALRALIDGRLWMETPVLLGLAATVYRTDQSLPSSTIELYGRAIDHLLHSDRLPERCRGDALRPTLRDFARSCLLPAAGPPQVVFTPAQLPERERSDLRRTGLFEGETLLRFTHLSLGERLAAEAGIDLDQERAKLADADAREVEGNALEVLPMAHAIQGAPALEAALTDARAKDRADHRLLRLLLRSIGYGGEGVLAFCRTHAGEVVRLVAARMAMPSGRFGNAERKLMGAAEVAFLVMAEFVAKEEVEAAFGALVGTRGEAAAEAQAAMWILKARAVGRPAPARYWDTIKRQARALVREKPTVEAVLSFTRGSTAWEQLKAVEVLGKYPEHWPRLRPFLENRLDQVRSAAIEQLREDPSAQVMLRERLTDDEEAIRMKMVSLLGSPPARFAAYYDRLRGVLRWDPGMSVRAAAIDVLAHDAGALPWIRRALSETSELPKSIPAPFIALSAAAIRALADDDDSRAQIRRLLVNDRVCGIWPVWLFQDLVHKPTWRAILLQRLQPAHVEPAIVEALADDPEARSMIEALLAHERPDIVHRAIRSLQAATELYPAFVDQLRHKHLLVRLAAIDVLGKSEQGWTHLHHFLDAEDFAERAEALSSLRAAPSIRDRAFDMLLQDESQVVRHAAIGILGSSALERAALRKYFEDTRSKNAWAQAGSMHESLAHGYLRAQILEKLADGAIGHECAMIVEALNDPHPQVRATAVKMALSNPETQGAVVALADQDSNVRLAAYPFLAEDPEIRAELIALLDEDLWAVRSSSFHALMPYEAERVKLLTLLNSKNASGSERSTVIEPLLRDPAMFVHVHQCIDYEDSGAHDVVSATALTSLQHDAEVRRILRKHAGDPVWVRERRFALGIEFTEILATDPEAYPILGAHLSSNDANILDKVAPMLAEYAPAWPRIRELLDHPNDSVQDAALRALGKDEMARPRLLQALANERSLTRGSAAQGLCDVPEARPHFLPLLADDHDSVRGIAVDVLTSNPTPEEQTALRERLTVEPKETLRPRILSALASDPAAKPLLQDRLHHDPVSAIRTAAARALGRGDERTTIPLAELPSIQRVLALLRGETLSAPDAELANRLNAFIAAPHPLDLDADPAFGELLLAWACVRLTWASADGALTPTQGRIFGEVEARRERLSAPGPALVVRVAMDLAELPRERLFYPNHNTIEARRVVMHLFAAEPPAIVLACADTAFEHLPAPAIEPGEARWGPTFFGFRLGTGDALASALSS